MAERDKGLVTLAGRPLIGWVIERLQGQVDQLVISANRNLDDYGAFGYPVIADQTPDQPGPLAGILAASRLISADWMLVTPCDTPFLPFDLVARLRARAKACQVPLIRAADADRTHYAIMLFHRTLLMDLAVFLASGARRVQDWQSGHAHADARFDGPDCFLNINTEAERWDVESRLTSW